MGGGWQGGGGGEGAAGRRDPKEPFPQYFCLDVWWSTGNVVVCEKAIFVNLCPHFYFPSSLYFFLSFTFLVALLLLFSFGHLNFIHGRQFFFEKYFRYRTTNVL